MKSLKTALAVTTILMLTTGTHPAFAQAVDLTKLDLVLRSVPDGPVAKVNGVNISKEDFVALYKAEVASLTARAQQQVPDSIRLQTGVRCVGLLIEREILRQEATARKITVSDDELQKRWTAYSEHLQKAMSGKKAAGQVTEADVLKNAGTTKEAALKELRETLTIEKMREQIAKDAKVTVTDTEIKKAYDENKDFMKRPESVHLQRIYANTRKADEQKKAQARERINNALKRVQAGEQFEAVAKAVTDAPDKERGGDPGMIPMSALPPSYVQKLSTMKPGQVSNVFEDDLGFHIIKLIELTPGKDIDLATATPMLRAKIMNEKTAKAVDDFCKPYRKNVQVFLQLEKILSTYPGFEEATKKIEAEETQNTAKPGSGSGQKSATLGTVSSEEKPAKHPTKSKTKKAKSKAAQ